MTASRLVANRDFIALWNLRNYTSMVSVILHTPVIQAAARRSDKALFGVIKHFSGPMFPNLPHCPQKPIQSIPSQQQTVPHFSVPTSLLITFSCFYKTPWTKGTWEEFILVNSFRGRVSGGCGQHGGSAERREVIALSTNMKQREWTPSEVRRPSPSPILFSNGTRGSEVS